MPGVPVLDGVVKEMKTSPYTMLLLVGLIFAVPYIWTHAAWADQVQAIQSQVAQLNLTVIRGNLEAQLRQTETDLFNLQQKVKELEVAHKPVDPLNYGRINDLQIQKSQLERQLAMLK